MASTQYKSPTVYLAYDNSDEKIATEIKSFLIRTGYSVLDHHTLDHGTDLSQNMKQQLQIDGMFALMTRKGETSHFFNLELQEGKNLQLRSGNKKFLLILLYDVEIPKTYLGTEFVRLTSKKSLHSQEFLLLDYLDRKVDKEALKSASGTNDLEIQSQGNSFWLAKINEQQWPISSFSTGQGYLLSSAHHEGKNQEDLEHFANVKPGDTLLAFAMGSLNALVATFVVEGTILQPRAKTIELKLVLDEIIDPHIPVSELAHLPFAGRLNYESREKLYPLATEQAVRLLELRSQVPTLSKREGQLTNLSSDHEQGEASDQLGIMHDVRAMAAVITYKEVTPPLSIGLFGNWGSGKSFFMLKLEKEIDRLAQSESPHFCKEIVSIRFNSWHYSDANLWASLCSRIFEELDHYGKRKDPTQLAKLYQNLNSTTEQLADNRARLDQASSILEQLADKVAANEIIIKEKIDRLQEVSLLRIGKAILAEPIVSKDLQKLREISDVGQYQDIEALQSQAREIHTFWGKTVETAKQLYRFRKGKLPWAIIFSALILLATLLAWLYREDLKTAYQGIRPHIIMLIVFGTQLLALIRPAMKVVEQISARLTSLSQKIEVLKKQQEEKYASENAKLKAELFAKESEQASLREQQTQLEVKKQFLQAELDDIRTGKKVVSFIESKVADERYLNSLGIISWIRKDFERLDYLLKQQHEAAAEKDQPIPEEQKTFKIDRIVLYIDDLDRCDALTVVKVLEAMHLLLAFPLFVVVVGVDPRWMEKALKLRFKEMINEREDSEKADKLLISPAAYLEKIFQIPFRLMPVDQTGFEHLVDAQFDRQDAKEDNTSAHQTEEIVTVGAYSPSGQSSGNTVQTIRAKRGKREPLQKPLPMPKIDLLEISGEETAFMKTLGFLIPNSPRSIKRYVNMYRIIRSHGNLNLSANKHTADYQAIMFLLAILNGAPDQYKEFFKLLSAETDGTSFKHFLAKHSATFQSENLRQIFDEKTRFPTDFQNLKIKTFKGNINLIERFSFKT